MFSQHLVDHIWIGFAGLYLFVDIHEIATEALYELLSLCQELLNSLWVASSAPVTHESVFLCLRSAPADSEMSLGENGLDRKSEAPRDMARSLSLIADCVEMMMIGISFR